MIDRQLQGKDVVVLREQAMFSHGPPARRGRFVWEGFLLGGLLLGVTLRLKFMSRIFL